MYTTQVMSAFLKVYVGVQKLLRVKKKALASMAYILCAITSVAVHKKVLCFNNKTSFETAAVKFAYNDTAYSRSKVVTTTRQRALQPQPQPCFGYKRCRYKRT